MAVSAPAGCRTITMSAVNDTYAGKVKIQGISFDTSAAGTVTITNAAGNVICTLRSTSNILRDWIEFPRGYIANGLKLSAISSGTVYFFLAE